MLQQAQVFRNDRKRNVDQIVAEASVSSAMPVDPTDKWTDQHEKEAELQRKRRRTKALQTAAVGGLTAREALQEDVCHQDVLVHQAEALKNVTKYCKQKKERLPRRGWMESALLSCCKVRASTSATCGQLPVMLWTVS